MNHLTSIVVLSSLLFSLHAFAKVKNEGSYSPALSKDGKSVAYHINNEDNFWDIVIEDIATRERKYITNNNGYDTGASWAPDNTKLLYSSNKNGKNDVFIYTIATEQTHILISSEHSDNNAIWSPNGKNIVFISNRTGNKELFNYHLKSKTVTQITKLNKNINHVSWSSDGKFIIFDIFQDKKSSIYQLELSNLKVSHLYKSDHSAIAARKHNQYLYVTQMTNNGWDIIGINLHKNTTHKVISTPMHEMKIDINTVTNQMVYSQQDENGIFQIKLAQFIEPKVI